MPSFDHVLVLFFIVFFPLIGCSQTPSNGKISKKVISLIKAAEEALLNQKIEEAEKLYLKAIEKKSDYVIALRGLSTVYQLQGKHQLSAELLSGIIAEKPHFSRILYAETAIAFFRSGEYELAETYLKQFEKIIKLPISKFGINGQREISIEGKYVKNLANNIKACQLARSAPFSNYLDTIINLEAPINSTKNEYFPFLTDQGSQLYFTRREANENLYLSKKEQTNWSIPTALDASFNTNLNEGMATFTRDARKIYFTACQRTNVQGTCDIQNGFLINGKIDSIQVLKGNLNSDGWESQACVSCDGRSIFFASNRAGGFGSTDIYFSQLQADQRWSIPENLGSTINTAMDEEAPFITDDGQTLFFSSTGHLGLGEQDIYMSQLQENGEWGVPVNLGPPINTGYRELGFYLSGNGMTGYFSSDRPNGIGKMDIYEFNLKEKLPNKSLTFVEGFVKDSVTRTPIQTVLLTRNNLSIPTDKDGRFFRCIPSDEIFSFNINEKGYQPFSFSEAMSDQANQNTYHLDILLSPIKKILTENSIKEILPTRISKTYSIYFDFDVYFLTAKAKSELDWLVKKLNESSIGNIEIIGYTDPKGSKKYNDNLSKKRAETVAKFLKQSEIPFVESEVIIEGQGVFQDSSVDRERRKVEITWTLFR